MDCDVSSVANCVISDTLGVPDVKKIGWFKHSTEKLETSRSRYSKCLHFELSGIGKTTAEKQKLRSWKKNCGFCKIKRPSRSLKNNCGFKRLKHEDDAQDVENTEQEESDSHVPEVEESKQEKLSGMGEIKANKGWLSGVAGWITRISSSADRGSRFEFDA